MHRALPARVIDLGRMSYAEAYAEQERVLEGVLASRQAKDEIDEPSDPGTKPADPVAANCQPENLQPRSAGTILLVEHDPPVITVSRRPGALQHLVASPEALAAAGVEVAQTDRGGDITYHGPGQLVVYPIIDLNLLRLRLHEYMRLLEAAVIAACARFGLSAGRDVCATGVWVPGLTRVPGHAQAGSCVSGHVDNQGDQDTTGTVGPRKSVELQAQAGAKICAMGVRVRRWVTMHGLALNVTTDLEHFKFIVPCGLAGRPVTSLQRELGAACPTMLEVKQAMAAELNARLCM